MGMKFEELTKLLITRLGSSAVRARVASGLAWAQ